MKAVMKDSGTAMLGVGVSSSKNRAEEAAEQATLAPLIGSSIQSATGVVYNITGGKDITLQEVNRVSQVMNFLYGFLNCFEFEYKLMFLFGYTKFWQVVTSLADPSANIIFGAVVDDRYSGEIHVTIIATGFSQSFQKILLADPRASKLIDKVTGGDQEKSSKASSPLRLDLSPAAASPTLNRGRRLFF